MEEINKLIGLWAQEFVTLAESDDLKGIHSAFESSVLEMSLLSFDEGRSRFEQLCAEHPETYDTLQGLIFRLLVDVDFSKLKNEINDVLSPMQSSRYFSALQPTVDTPVSAFIFILRVYYKQIMVELNRHIQLPSKKK